MVIYTLYMPVYVCIYFAVMFAFYVVATISGYVQMLSRMLQHPDVLNDDLRICSQYFYIVHVPC